jgi:hypothetical protein
MDDDFERTQTFDWPSRPLSSKAVALGVYIPNPNLPLTLSLSLSLSLTLTLTLSLSRLASLRTMASYHFF